VARAAASAGSGCCSVDRLGADAGLEGTDRAEAVDAGVAGSEPEAAPQSVTVAAGVGAVPVAQAFLPVLSLPARATAGSVLEASGADAACDASGGGLVEESHGSTPLVRAARLRVLELCVLDRPHQRLAQPRND
jgi:hypothetical protein